MCEDDYHGIKALVSQVSTGPLTDLTALSDTIVNQVNIGTSVTTVGGDSGVCAMGTILNINQHKTNPGMVCLISLLKDIAKKNPKSTKGIHHIVSANPEFVTGLMLKERLINFPPELARNLHKILIEDVNWSASDEYEPDAGEKREDYQFTHLLFLSSFEVECGGKGSVAESTIGDEDDRVQAGEPAATEEAGLGHRKKRKMDKKAAASARLFHHWEDEILLERALFSHSWQNATKSPVVRANRKYQPFSILYAMRWSDYVELAESISQA